MAIPCSSCPAPMRNPKQYMSLLTPLSMKPRRQCIEKQKTKKERVQ